MNILTLKNLQTSIDDKKILNGIDLSINSGEVHVIMGPNGAGKSSLAATLVGNESFNIEKGNIILNGENINEKTITDRAALEMFLAFQYPVEIPGVSVLNFLRTTVNEMRKKQKKEPYDTMDFVQIVKEKIKYLDLSESILKRSLNSGFSGGEKKKLEILQMYLLEPSLIILDEIDSGLDVDALKLVAKTVNDFKDKKRSLLIITHYQRLLEYIKPDYVHILYKGKIVKTGDASLAKELDSKGYEEFVK